MTLLEAEKIITDFGKVLEMASQIGLAIPEEFLPHKKIKIEEAFKIAYPLSTKESKDILKQSFIHIPRFIPIDEATVVFRYMNWITKQSSHNDSDLREQALKIQNRINSAMEEYSNRLN